MSSRVHLFISPHFDDVALSCGGYVRHLAAVGESVIVVTVFAGDPAAGELSVLAQRNQATWRLDDEPIAARRREDVAAMQLLGAQYRHLGFLDAIYRRDSNGRPLYTRGVVGVPVHLEDGQYCDPLVRHELMQVLGTYQDQDVRVYLPLGAGQHVDHLIVRRAFESACRSEVVAYYEDFPYASQPGALQSQLRRNGTESAWQATLVGLTQDEADARIAVAACYVSQVPGLFPSPIERAQAIVRAHVPVIGRYFDRRVNWEASRERMAASVRSYIKRVGGERYWQRGTVAPRDWKQRL